MPVFKGFFYFRPYPIWMRQSKFLFKISYLHDPKPIRYIKFRSKQQTGGKTPRIIRGANMGSKTHEMRGDWILPIVAESTRTEGKFPQAISTITGVKITHVGKRGDINTPLLLEEITYTASVGVYPPGHGEIPSGERNSEWGFMTTRDDTTTRPDDVGIYQRAKLGSFAPTQMDVIPPTWREDLMGADPLMWGYHTTNFVDWFEEKFPRRFFATDEVG